MTLILTRGCSVQLHIVYTDVLIFHSKVDCISSVKLGRWVKDIRQVARCSPACLDRGLFILSNRVKVNLPLTLGVFYKESIIMSVKLFPTLMLSTELEEKCTAICKKKKILVYSDTFFKCVSNQALVFSSIENASLCPHGSPVSSISRSIWSMTKMCLCFLLGEIKFYILSVVTQKCNSCQKYSSCLWSICFSGLASSWLQIKEAHFS